MSCEEETPPDDGSVPAEDMDDQQEVISSTEAVGVTGADGLSFGGAGELQMPGLGMKFGVELKLPSLAMDNQLPVGPLP